MQKNKYYAFNWTLVLQTDNDFEMLAWKIIELKFHHNF